MKWLIVVILLFFACEGPTGSQGEQGLQGPTGDTGADGADGVANISAIEFTVLESNWIQSASDEKVYYYQKDIAEITSEVMDNGVVLVQTTTLDGVWWPLPHTYGYDWDDDYNVDFTEEYRYAYVIGAIEVSVEQSTDPVTPSFMFFKVVIIPPAE